MSSHYEQRLQNDLDWIQELVTIVGNAIGEALDHAVKSVMTGDKDLAASVIIGDFTVNRQTRELDRLCHAFVARHLPSAGHLRYVSSVLRLGIALERIGDYATTIARTAAQLSEPPPPIVVRDIELMAGQARRLLQEALRSFTKRDATMAQTTLSSARRLTDYFDRVLGDLTKEGEQQTRPMKDLFALMATFNRLERVIHQAKNLCEETVFVVSGRTKGEKQFDILFVDGANAGASLLAEHFTRKAFPQSGQYRSAGWEAAEEVDPEFIAFAKTVGLELAQAWPTSYATVREQLDDFQLVIGIGEGVREKIGEVPFHTTVVHWEIDPTGGPEAVYREITPRIRDLMELLRGEQAS